ncbi:2-(3-amino-3-carboxypropyl)histidine synthase subunit 1 [Eurytemora carolleeae]|uniref:2-(3-amino-3-carboxypropyl)histidine synthase subunit 1 n=1 Tax=Eurytemora carolleeae TaxID=1294199 RepID=UPI000C771BD0|nr:2-(3-amino-3-carboxypropyl)histidine synthase subunit 1 [Eurytemora carolleeae]|eukprot:XP_023342495.1 2-(3-amino-3-carboxypropyl)histidine synthase subunit 1-like [Eurytemora affinis]
MEVLPENYNLEVPKTIWRIRKDGFKKVALQLPEGLTMFATALCDIIESFTDAETLIMSDVTYGACCVDDFSARNINYSKLKNVLVPVDQTSTIKMLYIFVDIKMDTLHFTQTVKQNIDKEKSISLVSTIQFVATLQAVAKQLRDDGYTVFVPQVKPLSPGEILGCTSPKMETSCLIYLGDGRFHLGEQLSLGCDFLIHYGHSCLVPVDQTSTIKMLYIFVDIKMDTLHFTQTVKQNIDKEKSISLVSTIQFVATLQAVAKQLRDDGYTVFVPQVKPLSPGEILVRKGMIINIFSEEGYDHEYVSEEGCLVRKGMIMNMFSEEGYDHELMKRNRLNAINQARNSKTWGIILGTLGRQGNPNILYHLKAKCEKAGKEVVTILLSEIFPQKLSLMPEVGAWIQIACPRLSIDWGLAFKSPILSPYEAAVALEEIPWQIEVYPMDFYANESLGPWTPNHKPVIDILNPKPQEKVCCGNKDCDKKKY